jgi:hypothetical protein
VVLVSYQQKAGARRIKDAVHLVVAMDAAVLKTKVHHAASHQTVKVALYQVRASQTTRKYVNR